MVFVLLSNQQKQEKKDEEANPWLHAQTSGHGNRDCRGEIAEFARQSAAQQAERPQSRTAIQKHKIILVEIEKTVMNSLEG